MAKGRALQCESRSAEALSIFQNLYRNYSPSPRDKRTNGLALGRLLQAIGGMDNLTQARAIFTGLRTQAGRDNTPCDDKEIELALGMLLQTIGECGQPVTGPGHLYPAAHRAAGRNNTPCDDKEIELTLASIYLDMGMWREFDELQLEKQQFGGGEPQLCLSIRHFREVLETENISSIPSALFRKIMDYASLAVENSGYTSASCISQLAHCFRLLSLCPKIVLENLCIEQQERQEFQVIADYLFNRAYELEPNRQALEKGQPWRQKERELLSRLKKEQGLRSETALFSP